MFFLQMQTETFHLELLMNELSQRQELYLWLLMMVSSLLWQLYQLILLQQI